MASVQGASGPERGRQLAGCVPVSNSLYTTLSPAVNKLLMRSIPLTSDVSCISTGTVKQQPEEGACHLHRPLTGDSPIELNAVAVSALCCQQLSPSPTPLSDAGNQTDAPAPLVAHLAQQGTSLSSTLGGVTAEQSSCYACRNHMPSRLIANSVLQQPTPCSRPGSTSDVPAANTQQQGLVQRQDTAYQENGLQATSSTQCHTSYFTSLGRPVTHRVQRRRVWVHDVPARWRLLRCRTPRAESGVDPSEVQFLLQGGFWQPSCTSSQGDAATDQAQPQRAGSSIAGLSRFMQQQLRILQREADEVVQLLHTRNRRSTASNQSEVGSSACGPGLAGLLLLRVLGLLCCCQPTLDAEADDEPVGALVHIENSYTALPGYIDTRAPVTGASPGLQLQEAAERELARRLNQRSSQTRTAYNVLRWGRGDPLRTPLLPKAPIESSASFHTTRVM